MFLSAATVSFPNMGSIKVNLIYKFKYFPSL